MVTDQQMQDAENKRREAHTAARVALEAVREPADRAHAAAVAAADKAWHDAVDPAEEAFQQAVEAANSEYNQAVS